MRQRHAKSGMQICQGFATEKPASRSEGELGSGFYAICHAFQGDCYTMRLNLTFGRLAVAAAALAAGFAAVPARADVVGDVTCNIAPGVGAVVVSSRDVACTFRTAGGPAQLYTGKINRLGVDIGNQDSAVLTYAVTALGTPAPGALAGEFVGPGFGLTLGTGGGLNALVGGGNSFVLQPISATTSTGTNFNAGVGELHLVFAGLEPGPMAHRRHHRHHRM
jgi:Protein of unknown function (DUF992)